MAFTSVTSPAYADAAAHTILATVEIDGGPPGPYLFCDGDAVSQSVFNALKAGTYGAIAAYAAPTPPSPTKPQLYAYADAHAMTLLATARSYDLGSGVSVLCDATTATGVNLNALLTWATANPSGSRVWIDNEGTRTTLTAAQVTALAQAALAYALSVYDPGLAGVGAAIDAGTVATLAAVDAYAWPT